MKIAFKILLTERRCRHYDNIKMYPNERGREYDSIHVTQDGC